MLYFFFERNFKAKGKRNIHVVIVVNGRYSDTLSHTRFILYNFVLNLWFTDTQTEYDIHVGVSINTGATWHFTQLFHVALLYSLMHHQL